MTLCDYYAEKASEDSSSLADPNSWAVNYINIGRSRSILGAFNDNSNGFVTTDEVNNFIRSRPFNWRCAIFLDCKESLFIRV